MEKMLASTGSTNKLIRPKEFFTRLGISKSKFYMCVAEGKIPKPVKLSERVSVWPDTTVTAILDKVASGELKL